MQSSSPVDYALKCFFTSRTTQMFCLTLRWEHQLICKVFLSRPICSPQSLWAPHECACVRASKQKRVRYVEPSTRYSGQTEKQKCLCATSPIVNYLILRSEYSAVRISVCTDPVYWRYGLARQGKIAYKKEECQRLKRSRRSSKNWTWRTSYPFLNDRVYVPVVLPL